MSDDPGSHLRLTLEPSSRAPAVARLFVAEAARVAGLTEQRIHDLRLAVSEMITDALTVDPDQLTLEITSSIGRIEVVGPSLSPDPLPSPSTSRVLEGIPTVEVRRTPSATVLVCREEAP